MRKAFSAYFPPTEDEFEALWQEALFSFDANVLLHIYRYSPKTREGLFRVLTELKDRVWITHQAGYEFAKDRPKVMMEQVSNFETMSRHVLGLATSLENQLSRHGWYAYLTEGTDFVSVLGNVAEKMNASIDRVRSEYPSLSDDSLLDRLSKLLDGKIGEGFDNDRLQELYTEGQGRYDKKLPPGYEDVDKEIPERYGDFILWRQLLDYAKSAKDKKPVILITDDRKEDWWWQQTRPKEFTTGNRSTTRTS